MQQKVIKKVLLELAKDKPDLSYIRGLLEGLVEEDTVITSSTPKLPEYNKILVDNIKVDEEEIPAFAKTGPIGHINS